MARFACILAAGLAVHVAHALTGFGGPGVDRAISAWLYDAILFGAAALCAARAVQVPRRRAPWLILAVEGTPAEDTVTLGDVGWLTFYPACYVAVGLILRARVPSLPRSVWLDGLIVAAATGATAAALILPTLRETAAELDGPVLIVNMGYPVGDLMLLMMVFAVFTLTAWRLDRMWLMLGGGLVAMGAADALYLDQLARDTYVTGGLVDSLWLAAALLVGASAWQPAPRSAAARRGLRTLLLPVFFGLVALGLETYDHFERLDHGALALASTTLVLVLARLFFAFRENVTMLDRSRREALTDSLTGLGNRRMLMADLEHAFASGEPALLVVYDLDGFKNYNDSFGHPAGDALLARLGHKLAEGLGRSGFGYRLGGDEFCTLTPHGDGQAEEVRSRAARSLTEQGRGFVVGNSHGGVLIPAEASTPAEALQIADQRLYRQKSGRSGSARSQARAVLMRVLREREPELHEHLRNVATLALAVGRRLGMAMEDLDELARGAELHDVGKMAVPDTILDKQGPLDDTEWAFIHRHTLIGEGILAAAPALVPVARLVRSSHERYDGKGYPDGLAGEDIPLGARVIFACDAYDAMVTERPYAGAMTSADALEQIRRGSGAQFDPRVVDALADAVAAGEADRVDLPAGSEIDLWSPAFDGDSIRPA